MSTDINTILTVSHILFALYTSYILFTHIFNVLYIDIYILHIDIYLIFDIPLLRLIFHSGVIFDRFLKSPSLKISSFIVIYENLGKTTCHGCYTRMKSHAFG